VILATGARPRILPGLEPDGHLVWTYYHALRPPAVPARLVIVGAGAIGVEFASIYAAMGTTVTLVEQAPRILPAEDAEIAGLMAKALQKRGIIIYTAVPITRLDRTDDSVALHLSDGTVIQADRLLSAAGVVPNIDGLQDLGVETAGGAVRTDTAGRTSVPGLYAIGDVAGPPMLAHKAEHDGVACVDAIAGRTPALSTAPIPACIYANPQIASVGLTADAAAAAGLSTRTGRFSLRGNGKALVIGAPDGLVKCVFDTATDRLVGAQIIGPDASELIHGLTIAVTLGATSTQLAGVVFPHPTLSEALHEAVLAARDHMRQLLEDPSGDHGAAGDALLADLERAVREADGAAAPVGRACEEGLCAAAIKLAKAMGPGHTIVTVLCDHGSRYQSKLFNPAFLKEKGLPTPPWM
jgi:dihydrolipoamide dehydrogenase